MSETSIGAARRRTLRPRTSTKCTKRGIVGREQDLQVIGGRDDPHRQRLQVVRRVGHRLNHDQQLTKRLAEPESGVIQSLRQRGRQRRAVSGATPACPEPRRGAHVEPDRVEQRASGLLNIGERVGGANRQRRVGQVERAERMRRIASQFIEAVRAQRDPEVLSDDILELMRLVDDRQRALGNDFTEAALAHRRVRAQQVVVDDDEVRLGGALAHAGDEAVRVLRAFATEALIGGGRHVLPNRRGVRQVLNLATVAGLGDRRPLGNAFHPPPLFWRHGGPRLLQPREAVLAEVVRSPFHVGGADVAPERARHAGTSLKNT